MGVQKKEHRLNERYIDQYKLLAKPNFSMVPIYPNIYTFSGYYDTNLQHPNLFGYEQIAYSIYGWIKYQISQWMSQPVNLQIECYENYNLLNWLAVNGAINYKIIRSVDPYSNFVEIGTSTTPNYTDIGITNSIKYFYKVIAINNDN